MGQTGIGSSNLPETKVSRAHIHPRPIPGPVSPMRDLPGGVGQSHKGRPPTVLASTQPSKSVAGPFSELRGQGPEGGVPTEVQASILGLVGTSWPLPLSVAPFRSLHAA